MTNANSRRLLTFEQMEQRLPLSAAPVINSLVDFKLDVGNPGLTWELVNQGGTIQLHSSATALQYRDGNGHPLDQGFIDVQGGDLVFSEPAHSWQRTNEQDEVGSLISPIAQPHLGDDDYSRGAISVAEIFRSNRPTELSQSEEHLVQSQPVDNTVAGTNQDSWKSISLSRGRDMYFEVAALSEDESQSKREAPRMASEIAPLLYQQTLRRQDAEQASSTTSTDHSPQRPTELLPGSTRENQSPPPAETKLFIPPAKNTEGKQSERTAQDQESPPGEHYSRNLDPRDHVFAIWHEGDNPSDEAVALRDDAQQTHSATWPVLAALAASGWIAKSRLTPRTPPSEQVPPPKIR